MSRQGDLQRSEGDLADLVCEVLGPVLGWRDVFQREADERGVGVDQLAAAAVAEAVRERFVVLPHSEMN